ncbi:hypothetical protein DFA_07275 [Cavenderia fasciculata]|uniref:Fe2OG dioxygenase domain-containing protein n=1 Tax=Cavenderia fasciculata TaxID=261658 RepID=F4PVZ1_CACFS|nr:uncharacterized protein DFA_07275 [Cavenderia fasciculata]EGG20155.1 hypothetical protein DFA_07275 [Cavenderia fasciculata]|eukprot:XP_004367138.1 hypothetical protein DFA_07275 [Cavenderia fasciculata]
MSTSSTNTKVNKNYNQNFKKDLKRKEIEEVVKEEEEVLKVEKKKLKTKISKDKKKEKEVEKIEKKEEKKEEEEEEEEEVEEVVKEIIKKDVNNNEEFKFIINLNNIILKETLLKDNARVRFCSRFLTSELSTYLYQHLREDLGLNYEHSKIKMYGKEIFIPRLQSWMSSPTDNPPSLFQKQPAREWSVPMLHLKHQLESLLGQTFDYVLINYYRDGNDYIGYHSDGEAKKEAFNVIASVSLGTTRRFILRNNKDNKEKVEYSLNNGSLLVMDRDTQSTWKHQVPKQPKVLTPRINLTFRKNNNVVVAKKKKLNN